MIVVLTECNGFDEKKSKYGPKATVAQVGNCPVILYTKMNY